jgi:hypothetical protein
VKIDPTQDLIDENSVIENINVRDDKSLNYDELRRRNRDLDVSNLNDLS